MTAPAPRPGPDVAGRLAEALAAEMARHRDVIELVEQDDADPFSGRFRYGCTCGHERGIWTEREAVARIQQSADEQRRHVAERLAAIAAERAAEAWDEGYEAAEHDAMYRPYSDQPAAATWKPIPNPYRAALRGEGRG